MKDKLGDGRELSMQCFVGSAEGLDLSPKSEEGPLKPKGNMNRCTH